jgi:hypothetical protein
MVSWNWDESQAEDGVVHQAVSGTDHDSAARLKQGYDYANFSEITPDPVSCWPFHGQADDVVGSSDGTVNGASAGTGLLGTDALSFDGTDDNVTTPNTASDGGLTVSFWVYMRTINSGSDDTILYPDTVNANNNNPGIFEHDGGGNQWRWSTSNTTSTTTDLMNENEWIYVTLTHDTSTARLYLNGSERASSAGSLSTASGTNLRWGSDVDNNENIDGRLYDCRIYDQALTASEIQTMYDVVNTGGEWDSTVKTL